MKKQYSLDELARFLDAKLHGDASCVITAIAPIDEAHAGQLSFLENAKYRDALKVTQATAVIVRAEDVQHVPANALIVTDPYLAYAKLTSLFNDAPKAAAGIHSTAIIGQDCHIDPSASIGAYVVIGNGVTIAKDAIIGALAFIDDHVQIGAETCLHPRVVLYHRVTIGMRVIIHSGAVIGADGFGNANDRGRWQKIYQLGAVAIGDDVEIGANTTIDRGALSDTIIANGVKLDNQIQIGHNVQIGESTAVAGCTGIAGSTVIGKHCMIGGGVGISGHIKIVDGVIITGMSGVPQSLEKPGIYSSTIPVAPQLTWWRVIMRLMKIDELAKRVKTLEKKLNNG